jgi:Plasmid pRiA4b ORF-3-like protein
LLPLKLIGELDGRLSQPLNLALARPQLRSHPYLQGLNLLLRASGIVIVEGANAKARLVVDPSMLAEWNALNTVEQYFNLLEAWLRLGRGEMVGERGRRQEPLMLSCLEVWRGLPRGGHRFEGVKPEDVYLFGIYRSFYHVALMDLFGLLSVAHPRKSTGTWTPAGVDHTPFGDAALTLITSRVDVFSDELLPWQEDRDRLGATCTINHPEVEEGPWTDEVAIGSLPLEPGQSMALLYDFGDDWRFTVKLERIDPPGGKAKAPRIIEKHGKSPVQYEQSDMW